MAPQILVYEPVHQQFEQFDNSRQYRNATVIRNVPLLKMGVTNESFHLSRRIQVAC
jgi:hypothetical protein